MSDTPPGRQPERPAGVPAFVPATAPAATTPPSPAEHDPAPVPPKDTVPSENRTTPEGPRSISGIDARRVDLAAHLLLAGAALSFIVVGLGAHVVDGAFSRFPNVQPWEPLLGQFWPVLVAFAAGLLTIFKPPGRAAVRNTSLAAWLVLVTPMAYGLGISLRQDAPRVEAIIEAVIRSAFGSGSILAIAALVTLHQRDRPHSSPHLVVGALLVANFFGRITEFNGLASLVDDRGELLLLVAGIGVRAASLLLIPAAVLVALDRRSHLLNRLLRNATVIAGVVTLASSMVIYFRAEVRGRDTSTLLVSLPWAIWIIALVLAITIVVEPRPLVPLNQQAKGRLGATVFAAVLFWPLGLVALTAAANATAAAERGDHDARRRFEGKATSWRTATFAVFAVLVLVVLVA